MHKKNHWYYKKPIIIILFLFIGFSTSLVYFFKSTPEIKPYYSVFAPQVSRSPSDVSDPQISRNNWIEDYFPHNDYYMFINNRIHLDSPNLDFNKKLKRAFNDLVNSQNNSQFDGEGEFFLKTILELEYPLPSPLNILFYPVENFSLNLHSEIKGDTFKLKAIKKGQNHSDFNNLIQYNKIPSLNNTRQFIGGIITFIPEKNSVRLRARKFFRINNRIDFKIDSLNFDNYQLKFYYFKKAEDFDQTFYTIDLFLKYDHSKKEFEKEYLVAYPGKFLTEFEMDSPPQKILNGGIQTANLFLRGSLKENLYEYSSITTFKYLIYSFNSNSFLNESLLETSINSSKRKHLTNELSQKIKDQLLNQNKEKLIKLLNLEELL